MHFEELWEKCEEVNKDDNTKISSLIDEIMMKCNLYKVIEENESIPEEERKNVKSRTLGEILFALTNLSLQDNIDVFDALSTAFKYRSIEKYTKKYQS